MSGSGTTLAAAIAGTAGAVAFLALAFIMLRYYCLSHDNNTSVSTRTSDTNSSGLQAGPNTELTLGLATSYPSGLQGARGFLLEELNLATKDFNSINLIGYGTFGQVYKGLLQDGMIVAIKTRLATTSRDFNFIEEVCYLSSIRHRNLVSLLGYCQGNDQQMLIYEYIPNGSVSLHLYGASQVTNGKLEFKHRLSIAHGAAKGLAHLHSLDPPLLHMNFKTANVLVDEDFIPKVADAGIQSLLNRIGGASSQMATDDVFLDPEVKESGGFSLKSDVYSFGVFLLELVSGQEARSDQSIIEWAKTFQGSSEIGTIVDRRIGSRFSSESMRELLQLIAWCLNPSSEKRPPMNYVVLELERIHDKEMSLTTVMGEGTTTVTLGSQLFTTS